MEKVTNYKNEQIFLRKHDFKISCKIEFMRISVFLGHEPVAVLQNSENVYNSAHWKEI